MQDGSTHDGALGPGADEPLSFALGCVRSGTTMLRAMLDSHPELAVPPESYFVTPALHRSSRYGSRDGLDLDALLADIGADPSFGDWHLEPAELEPLRADPPPATVPEAVTRLYRCYARAHGKPRAADRTPSHVLEVDLLARSFPMSPFVHIVRDGRDVAPSVLEMDFGPDRFANAVLFWQDRVTRARAAGRRLGPDRWLEIRYEDLVADPERVLGLVCTFLRLPFDPAMLEYHERAGELIGGLRHTGHVQGVRRPPTLGVRDWRTTMPTRQVQLFEALAGDLLDELGYERSGFPTTTLARAEAAAWKAARVAELRGRTLRTRFVRKLRPGPAAAGV